MNFIRCSSCFSEYSAELDICPQCGFAEGEGASEVSHLAPGRKLKSGKYIIGCVLGYGGFGVTYLGWDIGLERKVAIKEYLPSEFSTRMPGHTQVTVYTGDKAEQFKDGAAKFVDEANRLAQLRGLDGIVSVYESFFENNTAYIVMEHLDGETLTEKLKREGKLTADEAAGMLMPVIRALGTVHKHGIIHRDIAPDNIMVTADGKVKLIDFGAARYAAATHSRSLTVVIKQGYSPEEQYRSRGDQGPWTDVYALGATLYRMVTGKTPPDAMERRAYFEGKKKDILEPPSKYARKIDNNTEMAILNAMNVRIEDRTPDMEAFESELTSGEPVKRRQGRIRKIDVLRWPVWLKVTVPVAACAAVALLVLLLTGTIGFDSGLMLFSRVPEGMVKVPSVIGYDLEKTEERIGGLLVLQITGKEDSDEIPADLVLSQSITAGSVVAVGTEFSVIISGGIESELTITDAEGRYSLADVTFRTLEQALEMFDIQGMVVTVVEEASETVAAGVIIRQEPVSGTPLMPGSQVTIVVSTGSASNPDGNVSNPDSPATPATPGNNINNPNTPGIQTTPDNPNNIVETPLPTDNPNTISTDDFIVVNAEIIKMPNKTTYYLHEYIDYSGMIIRQTYADGTTSDIEYDGIQDYTANYLFPGIGTWWLSFDYLGGVSVGFYIDIVPEQPGATAAPTEAPSEYPAFDGYIRIIDFNPKSIVVGVETTFQVTVEYQMPTYTKFQSVDILAYKFNIGVTDSSSGSYPHIYYGSDIPIGKQGTQTCTVTTTIDSWDDFNIPGSIGVWMYMKTSDDASLEYGPYFNNYYGPWTGKEGHSVDIQVLQP